MNDNCIGIWSIYSTQYLFKYLTYSVLLVVVQTPIASQKIGLTPSQQRSEEELALYM